MKYTKEERLEIGKRIYDGEISRYEAAEIYDIDYNTARSYMRMFRDVNNLPPKSCSNRTSAGSLKRVLSSGSEAINLDDYNSMSKEELIKELVLSRIAEARLKKGYEVKGDGSVIQYVSKNTK